ncbi:MAG: nitrile hydratase accessory protein [Pseudomonadota bacterium]
MKAPSPPRFEAPWHAEIFALTVHLNEAGHFSWSEWTERFGATLARHRGAQMLDGGDDYFIAWLETLERYLTDLGLAEQRRLNDLKAGWRDAYLQTPHGHPVVLRDV